MLRVCTKNGPTCRSDEVSDIGRVCSRSLLTLLNQADPVVDVVLFTVLYQCEGWAIASLDRDCTERLLVFSLSHLRIA